MVRISFETSLRKEQQSAQIVQFGNIWVLLSHSSPQRPSFLHQTLASLQVKILQIAQYQV